MRRLKVTRWDIADYLDTDERIRGFLGEIIKEDDPALLAAALGDVARAKGMTNIANETGLGRESLYKSLSKTGNPSFATVQKVLSALGLKFSVVPR